MTTINDLLAKVLIRVVSHIGPLPVTEVKDQALWVYHTTQSEERRDETRIGLSDFNAIRVCMSWRHMGMEEVLGGSGLNIIRYWEWETRLAKKVQATRELCYNK